GQEGGDRQRQCRGAPDEGPSSPSREEREIVGREYHPHPRRIGRDQDSECDGDDTDDDRQSANRKLPLHHRLASRRSDLPSRSYPDRGETQSEALKPTAPESGKTGIEGRRKPSVSPVHEGARRCPSERCAPRPSSAGRWSPWWPPRRRNPPGPK